MLATMGMQPTVGEPKKRGPAKGTRPAGRAKGTPNKVTTEFRETVQRLLDDNRDNVRKWVEQIAEGAPATYDAHGKLMYPARPPDPVGAARALGHFAEFAAPKLTRSEVTGAAGGALTVVVHKVA
jgi:hypothetical protein